MANLSELPQWDAGVYRLETTDQAEGGESGKANAPLKNLANRTSYLKSHVDALESASSDGSILADASTTVKGKVELATNAETITGTDTVRAVTPAGVAAAISSAEVPSASETVQGKVELATNAEAVTGTDTSRAVTPAGVAAAVSAQIIVAYGAIGSVCLARYGATSEVASGATVAGSMLTPSNTFGVAGGAALSGTWKLLGYLPGGGTIGSDTTSVWQRIA